MIKNKVFHIFLIINTFLWSLIGMIRIVPSFDAMEAICWGELLSFGTNKHPPLSGWLMSSFYHFCSNNNIAIYLLGQLCILVAFIFVYKIAKFFVSEEKAICSAMILEACFYYTYYYFTDNFNCNIVLYPLWVITIYCFYKAINENKIKQWVLFGIISGLAFLGKYQIIFLFGAMFLYLLIDKRETFKQKGLFIAILTGSLIILPHVIWLFQHDFFCFEYMIERTHANSSNVPIFLIKMGHIFFPVKFVVGQLIALAGCIFIYAITALQAKNISFKCESGTKSDKIFLLIIFFVPIFLQGLMGMITGERVPSIWGSIMVGLGGLMLFYFFPIKFKKTTFMYFIKLTYLAMVVSICATLCIASLQTNSIMFMPIQKIEHDINSIWNNQTNNAPLKYVGGGGMIAFPFKHFNYQKPSIILDTFGYENPWVDYDDIKKSGAIILGDYEEDTIRKTKEILMQLRNDNIIKTQKKYTIDVCNKLNKCEEKDLYYMILPPEEKNLKTYEQSKENKFHKYLIMFINLISN